MAGKSTIGISYGVGSYKPKPYVVPSPSVQSINRAARKVQINQVYGMYGGYNHFNPYTSSFFSPSWGYNGFESGYRIHKTTGEIKYYSSETLQSLYMQLGSVEDLNDFIGNYNSTVFKNKFLAARSLLDKEISTQKQIIELCKKKKKVSQPYHRKNYKFDGYNNTNYQDLHTVTIMKKAQEKIEELELAIEKIAIDNPEWLI